MTGNDGPWRHHFPSAAGNTNSIVLFNDLGFLSLASSSQSHLKIVNRDSHLMSAPLSSEKPAAAEILQKGLPTTRARDN